MAAFEGHALVKTIRTAQDSQQHDLGGYDERQARDLVTAAFSTPIEVAQPLRISFVIGAGKNLRQRYDEQLGKYLTSALRELNYTEDRGASASLDSQGTFKQQHDTGKNLKYLHVFPYVDTSGSSAQHDDGSSQEGSQDLLMAACSLPTFQLLVSDKIQSWAQKKRALQALHDILERFQSCERKLMAMEKLTAAEQQLYDATSADATQAKIHWLTAEVKAMMDSGHLTAAEKQRVLRQIEGKLVASGPDENRGDGGPAAGGAPEQAIKTDKQRSALEARRDVIQTLSPIQHRLKHHQELADLYRQLAPLVKLEQTKGRLLTIAEVRELGGKPQLEADIQRLEQESRGWFEEEEEFSARIRALKRGQESALGTKTVAKSAAAVPKTNITKALDGWANVSKSR